MQAIILAAGFGRRLGEFTAHNTKCMVEVNGVSFIDRMLRQLPAAGIGRIVIVTGYEGERLRRHVSESFPRLDVVFVDNPVYDKTNNIYSLWLARDYMAQEDTILLESDLIFDDAVLRAAIDSPFRDCALIAKYQTWMDGTMVKIDDETNIVNFIPKSAFSYDDVANYYKTVNIYKFSKEFAVDTYMPFLEAYIKVLGENEYYEQVLRVITLIHNVGLKGVDISGLAWYEIDDVQDLRIAETIFAEPEKKLKDLQGAFGGYWRYPGMLDFCYLVNPYFPPAKMLDEIKANFDILLREYPSGMRTNALLGARYFGLKEDYVVVGNGAVELIKSLMEKLQGSLGVVYPTFEEYPNRKENQSLTVFHPRKSGFRYDADELMAFFDANPVESLLLVNPDNPSGNFIPYDDVKRLIVWAKNRNIRLILDESFVDFTSGGPANSFLHNNIMEAYPTLVVMKSISKSYGVPGLRLGVLASGDRELIAEIRKDVAIWNINSFAEFYMQIFSKYESDYFKACEKYLAEREMFYSELEDVSYLKVFPSQANYFLCEITDRFTSHQLALRLLADYNILIKDCSNKKGFPEGGNFIRIAVRDRKDNGRLVSVLKSLEV